MSSECLVDTSIQSLLHTERYRLDMKENSESLKLKLNHVEITLTLTREEAVEQLLAHSKAPTLADCIDKFNWQGFPTHLYSKSHEINRIYFGGEFCERLLPDKKALLRVLSLVDQSGLSFSLITPIVSDHALARLQQLFSVLPDDSEVIVNDWGVLRLLRNNYPKLTSVIGRQLCKMIKDPRLPSAQWLKLYPHGVQSGPFQKLLAQFEIERLEMDVPPFAESPDFNSPEHELSVHLPFGFSVKGRMCKIGAMQLDAPRKFGPGHGCNKECLQYSSITSRGCSSEQAPSNTPLAAQTAPVNKAEDLKTFQQGNTLFYRHSTAMSDTLANALSQGKVNRMIFEGDWHEDYRTH